MSGAFLQLPLELLHEIVSYLSLEDILSLKRSCKPLSRMVYEPALRSYHSRMREAGLRDRPPPDGLSIRERLAALDRWETAWDNVHMSIAADPTAQQRDQQQVVEIATGDPDSHVLVVEGFYVEMDPLADGRADGCGYRYLDLTRASLQWEDACSVRHAFQQRVGILCYAFAIEKYDLFAVLIEAPWLSNQAALQLLKFHDCQPHPLARRNQPICITDRVFCVSKMHVVGDHLLIVMTVDIPGRPESWMTLVGLNDQSVITIDVPSTHFLNDIVILSHHTIALVNPTNNTLELCRLDTTAATLHKLRTLKLPPIHDDLVLFRVSTAHGASTDPPQDGAPPSRTRSSYSSFPSTPAALFYEDSERTITCIALHYTTETKSWNNDEWSYPEECARVVLVTRRSALCVLAATPAVAGDDAAQAQAIDAPAHTPWCTWSPAVEARVLSPDVFGAHATLHERLFVFGGGVLTHFDFNPHRARGALGERGRERCAFAPGIESLCGGKRGAWIGEGEGYGVADGHEDEDGDGGDDARETGGARGGDWDRDRAFSAVELPYRSTTIVLPGDSDVYFGVDRFVQVVKFGQGESPGVNGDEAQVCRRVVIHPMTG